MTKFNQRVHVGHYITQSTQGSSPIQTLPTINLGCPRKRRLKRDSSICPALTGRRKLARPLVLNSGYVRRKNVSDAGAIGARLGMEASAPTLVQN